jgi:hypothetical protein
MRISTSKGFGSWVKIVPRVWEKAVASAMA